MTFLREWLLAWHRAIWFPFNWMVGLESQPAESDQFTVQTDSEDEWGPHAGPLFKLQPDVHICGPAAFCDTLCMERAYTSMLRIRPRLFFLRPDDLECIGDWIDLHFDERMAEVVKRFDAGEGGESGHSPDDPSPII